MVVGDTPEAGLRVLAVEPDSPAARAGLQAGDLIVAADGRPLNRPDELAARAAGRRAQAAPGAGTELELRVRRQAEELSLRLALPAPTSL